MKKAILNLLFPMLATAGKSALVDFGQSWHDKHPETFKTLLQEIYPVIDVQLEEYAAETGNKLDDVVVADLKAACEELAKANGIELPNLDAGKSSD